ncbi:MAG: glycoside hydrolase family 3 protein [Treponema sp.]|nr:glycoside hydrolase family 3 protein [Treponema sp.]
MRLFYVFLACIFVFSGCERRYFVNQVFAEVNDIVEIDPIFELADEIAASFDDRLLAAQVLISGIDGNRAVSPHMRELLEEIPVGGIMLFRYNLNTDNDVIKSFLGQADSIVTNESGVPPFIAVDHEGGTVNRFRRGVADLPSASFYWELLQTEEMEDVLLREDILLRIEEDSYRAGLAINALGFNMNFAPVAEFLIYDNRDFLAFRSYGPDPVFVSQAAKAFVRGMREAGILCVAKHFPVSAGADPHYWLSELNKDRYELDKVVFPFAQLIGYGIRAVMTAHTLIPMIDSEIASLSSIVMNDWLRGELGFDGIIISDDFIMTAASSGAAGNLTPEEAAVRSIIAGTDMILVWPRDLRSTHTAILSALDDGRLSRERLVDAVRRIIYEKLKLGMLPIDCPSQEDSLLQEYFH